MIVNISFKDKTTVRYTDVHYCGANRNNPDNLFIILRRLSKPKAIQEFEQDKEILVPLSKIESYNVMNDKVCTEKTVKAKPVKKLEKKERPRK